MKTTLLAPLVGAALLCVSCKTQHDITHEVKPVTIEPIHITIDVNIRIDRQLDNFFDFEDHVAPSTTPAPVTGESR